MDFRMLTKLDIALIAVLVAAALVFLENSHRVALIAPASAGPAVASNPCAAANLRYATNLMVFLTGGYISGMRPRPPAAGGTAGCGP